MIIFVIYDYKRSYLFITILLSIYDNEEKGEALNKIKKRKVEWFLTFNNINLENDYFEQMQYLIRDMQLLFDKPLHPDLSSLLIETENTEIAEAEILSKKKTLKRLQDKAKKFLDEIIIGYQNAHEYKNEGGRPLTIFGHRDIIEHRTLNQMKIEVDAKVMIRNSPKLKRDPKTKQWEAFWIGDTLEKSPIELVLTPKGGDEAFLFSFSQALDGVLLKSIKQCSECNRWYFQSGRRERLVCSDKCRARKSNREKRKRLKKEGGKAYEDERKDGRRRAKESYDRRIHKKLGKNVKVGKQAEEN